jgi:hypothetical protein
MLDKLECWSLASILAYFNINRLCYSGSTQVGLERTPFFSFPGLGGGGGGRAGSGLTQTTALQ